MLLIANIIGWLATAFRSLGMLCKSANMVKYLVSVGNLCWMINGFMTANVPLIASNAICLFIMLIEILHWDKYLMWVVDNIFVAPFKFIWKWIKKIFKK